MPFPGQKCGGVGQPVCPPIQCIDGEFITINGKKYTLVPVKPDPEQIAEGIERNRAKKPTKEKAKP